ncbi:MAG: DMT family transporter [Rhodobacteraceae bacterium]|jgi:drug/metabolite transporter (DMT)-like permease|nr:DMT family transporter [Paracoccaceae bacterium]
METPNRTGLAIILSLMALALFDAMGLIIKLLSTKFSAAELSTWRNLFGLLPAFLVLYASKTWRENGKKIIINQWKLALLRGVIASLAQLCFYWSLGLMAFATASTITYSGALFATAFAIPILGERVGIVRWLAVIIGFIGVIFILQPGSDAFTHYSILPLAAAAFYALLTITAKLFDSQVSSALVNVYASLSSTVCAAILTLFLGGFSPISSLDEIFWIIMMGAFGGSAVLLYVVSYRMTEQSNLAPFSYFGIPIAFFFGWAFFDETPWDAIFPGGILIICGGLLIFWRERSFKRS